MANMKLHFRGAGEITDPDTPTEVIVPEFEGALPSTGDKVRVSGMFGVVIDRFFDFDEDAEDERLVVRFTVAYRDDGYWGTTDEPTIEYGTKPPKDKLSMKSVRLVRRAK